MGGQGASGPWWVMDTEGGIAPVARREVRPRRRARRSVGGVLLPPCIPQQRNRLWARAGVSRGGLGRVSSSSSYAERPGQWGLAGGAIRPWGAAVRAVGAMRGEADRFCRPRNCASGGGGTPRTVSTAGQLPGYRIKVSSLVVGREACPALCARGAGGAGGRKVVDTRRAGGKVTQK